MPGRRQRADEHDVHAGGDEARFERGFEHVAGQARVLADEHRAALGREHARRGAREAQREIHGHRVFADAAANAIGAEILTCHRMLLPWLTAAATRTASTRGGHVVGAHDTRSVENRNGGQCDAARQSLVHRAARELRQHGLARQARPTSGTPSASKRREMFEQREVVSRASCRIRTRDRSRVARHRCRRRGRRGCARRESR